MWTDRAPLLACPICGGSLRAAGGSLACAKSHSFDLARSGYVNLLPARKKISASVGDSRAMLEARERFLSTGHFAPLAEAVERLVVEALGHRRRRSSPHEGAIVEVGAGTGYYIARMKDRLDALPGISYFGIDVSKEAVRLGARRHTDIGFVLADVKRRIPLGDHNVLALLDIFAPRHAAEFERVLARDGVLLVAFPRADHLGALVERFALLAVPEDKDESIVGELAADFEVVARDEISYDMRLSPTAALDLIAMGPSARHVELGPIEEALRETDVRASFGLIAFRPRARG